MCRLGISTAPPSLLRRLTYMPRSKPWLTHTTALLHWVGM
jgi:hypothetical protein